MSDLITNKEEIKKLSNCLDILRSKGYNQATVENILDELIPQNENYILNYQVTNHDNEFAEPALFNPNENLIKISLNILSDYWCERMKWVRFSKKDEEELRDGLFKRMILFTILHEIEHVKQYFIANKFIECPYQTVINLYKNMFMYRCDDTNCQSEEKKELREIQRILFYMSPHRNSEKFYLERNANVVSNDTMLKICNYENDETFKYFFQNNKLKEIKEGYQGFWNGPAERSYHKLLLGNLFKTLIEDEDIPTEDRVCYGLPVDIKTRIKIVNRKFEI